MIGYVLPFIPRTSQVKFNYILYFKRTHLSATNQVIEEAQNPVIHKSSSITTMFGSCSPLWRSQQLNSIWSHLIPSTSLTLMLLFVYTAHRRHLGWNVYHWIHNKHVIEIVEQGGKRNSLGLGLNSDLIVLNITDDNIMFCWIKMRGNLQGSQQGHSIHPLYTSSLFILFSSLVLPSANLALHVRDQTSGPRLRYTRIRKFSVGNMWQFWIVDILKLSMNAEKKGYY